jgi:hypothetical protein
MKTLKKWVLGLCLAGPALTNFSCVSGLSDVVWQAVLDGTATFVQQATTEILSDTAGLIGAEVQPVDGTGGAALTP